MIFSAKDKRAEWILGKRVDIYGELPAEVADILANVEGLGGIFDAGDAIRKGCCQQDVLRRAHARVIQMHLRPAKPLSLKPSRMGVARFLPMMMAISAQPTICVPKVRLYSASFSPSSTIPGVTNTR